MEREEEKGLFSPAGQRNGVIGGKATEEGIILVVKLQKGRGHVVLHRVEKLIFSISLTNVD